MSHEIQLQSAAANLNTFKLTREEKVGRQRALVGDGAGNLVGNNGVPWVLCRLGGDVSRLVQAYNGTYITPAEGMSVMLIVKYREGRVDHYELEGVSGNELYAGYVPGASGALAAHHLSHEGTVGGGWDLVNVYPLNMTMLRCDAQATPDLTLLIAPGIYSIGGAVYFYAGGTSPAFTPPGSGSEYSVLTIDATGTLVITANGLTYPPFALSIPSDSIPIAAPYLSAGQTAITAADLLFDPRPFLSLGGSGGVSGNILQDSNGDSLLDSNSDSITT